MQSAFPWMLVLLLVAMDVFAQQTDGEIARETSDPTSDLWYLYTEFSLSQMPGRSFRESNAVTLEMQPSLPIPLSQKFRLLNFPDVVFATQGTPHGRQVTGVDSFSWLSALSPIGPRLGLSWGVGPYVSFPVATNGAFGESLWQMGVGGVLSWRAENFVASALVKSGWTTSGGEEAGEFQLQYNIQYFFGDGMQVGLGRPRVEYTWNRRGEGAWDFPVGVDIGRVFRFGKLPVKVLIEYDFYVINDSRWEPEHLFRLTFIPVFPSPIPPG